jgi:hypothetical protein
MKFLKSSILTSIFVIANSLSIQANAQSIDYLTCNYCSASEQKSVAIASGRNGKVNVIDFMTVEAKSFYVFNEPGENSAIPASPAPELDDALKILKKFKSELEELRTGNVPISNLAPYMYGSADISVVDVVQHSGKQYDIAQALTKYYKDKITASVRTIAAILTTSAVSAAIPTSYVITVQFGSSSEYFQFKFSNIALLSDGNVTMVFSGIVGSGRGEDVLLTSNGPGTFQVHGKIVNIEAFINALGFKVQYAPGDIRTGSGTIGCTSELGSPCILRY